jgi:C1A family cysteine protease
MKLQFLLFFVFLCNCGSINSAGKNEWEIFKATHHKAYQNESEDNFRKSIFLSNLELIESHNRKYDQGLVSYSLQINHFADHTVEELTRGSRPSTKPHKKPSKATPRAEVPDSIDWRDYGVITPIVDQDICLTCWAFAVVAALEGHVGIHLGVKNETLSEENLVDCVYSDFECKEEMERSALEDCYEYILDNGGIDTAASYPYDKEMEECRFKPENVGAQIKDYVTIAEGDEEEMKAVVGTIGPVSVIITADFTFMVYQKGVYYKEDCVNTKEPYNHAVTVVGYGTEDGQDYWLVKNEWGLTFGDQGYIKMARNRENNCGIATYATYPIV